MIKEKAKGNRIAYQTMQVVQEQEQEQDHWFTEEEIMPKWLKLLKEGKSCSNIDTTTHHKHEKWETLCINHTSFCIVGEAHGFSSAYFHGDDPLYCSDCAKFSGRFAMPAYTFDADYRAKFVEHMNERHKDTLLSRR
jgi:hypothetical protein